MSDIFLNLFIVTADLKTQKKYILSTTESHITIPRLRFGLFNKNHLKSQLSEYIRNIIPMNILGILPQVISLHSTVLASTYKKLNLYDDSSIECIYGCLVDHINPSQPDYYWIEFMYEIPNDYSANIFEVCQYLQ